MDEKIAVFQAKLDSFSALIEAHKLFIQEAEQKASLLKNALSDISFGRRQLEVDLEDLMVAVNKEKEKAIKLDRIKYLTDVLEKPTDDPDARGEKLIKIEALNELNILQPITKVEYITRRDKIIRPNRF